MAGRRPTNRVIVDPNGDYSPYSVDHFVPGDPRILKGTGPLVPPDAQSKKDFESLLKGRVIGRIADVGFPPNVTSLINITGPDHSAMPMTVTLTPPPNSKPSNPAGAFFPPAIGSIDNYANFDGAVAVVSWGTGGVQTYAEIDYGRGTTFSLYCSSLQVNVRREPTVAAPNPFSPAIQQWGAFVSHLPTPRFAPLTRTVRSNNGIPAPGLFNEFANVPPYAKSVRAYATQNAFAGPPAQFRLQLNDSNGFTQESIDWVPANNQTFPEIVFANNVSQISIINTDAAIAIDRWYMVFTLAL